MKILILFLLSFILLFTESCKKSDNPITPNVAQKNIDVAGYSSSLDSDYYAVWSDSSWEKFNRIITISGVTYITMINNTGDEYYYSAAGYAGFIPAGESLILFDKPIPGIPDTMVSNTVYTSGTAFYYQGNNFSVQNENTLLDTVNVSIPLGNFNCCIYMKSKSTITASSQSQTQSSYWWAAKGPSTIKQTLNSSITIVLVRGIINGEGWGMAFPEKSPPSESKRLTRLFNRLQSPIFRKVDVHIGKKVY
jgi:hypothetical protein